MRDLIVIDNFYNNPKQVREFALQQDFNVDGNYPGHRTKPFLNQGIVDYISGIIGREADIDVNDETSYCGAYQYTTAHDRTWIHADGWNEWAGVCYLTPGAPISGGTGLYTHKSTGKYETPRLENGDVDSKLLEYINSQASDYTKWELTDMIGNKFNRLVLYKGDYFHASLDYFGKDKFDGRLFQTFFFNCKG